MPEYTNRPQTNTIIIHCSATAPDADIGVEEIRAMHVSGRGWIDIGYHYVIRRNGVVEPGRPEGARGAHAKGMNNAALGVCLVGGLNSQMRPDANFTFQQWHALHRLVESLLERYPGARVMGHRSVAAKACPCFDVREWWYGGAEDRPKDETEG